MDAELRLPRALALHLLALGAQAAAGVPFAALLLRDGLPTCLPLAQAHEAWALALVADRPPPGLADDYPAALRVLTYCETPRGVRQLHLWQRDAQGWRETPLSLADG